MCYDSLCHRYRAQCMCQLSVRAAIDHPTPHMLTNGMLQGQGINKVTKLSIAQINRKVAQVRARAEKAAMIADQTLVNRNSELLSTGVKRPAFVSARMSSKGFGHKDPRHALQILQCMDIEAMHAYTFVDLGLVSYKYHVNTLSKELIAKSMYTSQRSAAMPATQVIRYLYEVAMELGSGPTRELLCWQHGQQTLQGRESRGAGVVAANAEAKALLVKALAACVERVEKRVMAANQYAAEMSATAAACA